MHCARSFSPPYSALIDVCFCARVCVYECVLLLLSPVLPFKFRSVDAIEFIVGRAQQIRADESGEAVAATAVDEPAASSSSARLVRDEAPDDQSYLDLDQSSNHNDPQELRTPGMLRVCNGLS
jgi:hypothetical protein